VKKQSLFVQFKELLQQKGITPLTDRETDIYLKCDFSSAKRGDIKVHYEASVYFDDSCNTVFYWDCVLLEDDGNYPDPYSRRPYRYCYVKTDRADGAADGNRATKVFHLADIPILIKRMSKKNGWKFKTVFNRNESFYPTLVISKHPAKVYNTRVIDYMCKPAVYLTDVLREHCAHAKQLLQSIIMFFPILWFIAISHLRVDVSFISLCLTAIGFLILYKLIALF
jgi:hypothetical protein